MVPEQVVSDVFTVILLVSITSEKLTTMLVFERSTSIASSAGLTVETLGAVVSSS